MSIENQKQALGPLKGTRWLCDTIRARLSTRSLQLSRLASVQVLALIAFAFILVASIQLADSASMTAVAKHRSSRNRGCYYMLQHYRNGEQIKTDEPCLNCTCENSMLMCYLRVCPYVKPVGDKCIIERVPGECCPRITCSDVAPPADSFEQDTIEPETTTVSASSAIIGTDDSASTSSTNASQTKQGAQESATLTASSLFDVTFTNATPTTSANNGEFATKSGGCMLGGQFYPEGAQMPADPSKSCEVCYCIRSSAACVMQDCALEVSGCAPIYTPGGCCPTRYNCSAENAFTTPRPKTLAGADTSQKRRKFWDLSASRFTSMASEGISSLMGLSPNSGSPDSSSQALAVPEFGRRGSSASAAPGAGCRAPNSTRLFADGERLPSKNKCEHCYCMRGELVCAVQECRPPCEGCVPIIDSQDQCCPKRYECFAPTQRVSTDNLIVEQQDPSSSATSSQQEQAASSNVTSTPASSLISTIDSILKDTASAVSTSTLAPPLDVSTSSDLAESTGSDNKQENSVMTIRQTKPPLRPISPKLSTTADEDIASEVGPKDDVHSSKGTKPSGGPQVSNVDGFNLNGGEREQETSDFGKSAGRVEAPEGSLGNNQQDSNEIPHSTSSTSSTQAPAEMASDEPAGSSPSSQPEKTIIVTNMPASPPMDGMNLVSSDRKPRPLVVPSQIPGEGSCRYKGRVYQNGDEIKSSQPCAGLCMCINSVVYCDEVDCPNPPENADKCQKINEPGVCCPKFVCPEEVPSTTTTTSTMSPSVESRSDTTVASEQPLDLTTSSTPAPQETSDMQRGAEAVSSTRLSVTSGEDNVGSSTETPTYSSPPESPKSTEISSTSAETTTAQPSSTSTQPDISSTSSSADNSSGPSTTAPTTNNISQANGSIETEATTAAAPATSEPSLEKSSESPVGSSATSEQPITTTLSPAANLSETSMSSDPSPTETSSSTTVSPTDEQNVGGGEESVKADSTTSPSLGIFSTLINFVTGAPPSPQTEPTASSSVIQEQSTPSPKGQPTIQEGATNLSDEQATTTQPEMGSKERESPDTNEVASGREEPAGSTTPDSIDGSSSTSQSSSPPVESTPSQSQASGVTESTSEPTTTKTTTFTSTTTPPPQTESSSFASEASAVTSTPVPETSSSSPVAGGANAPSGPSSPPPSEASPTESVSPDPNASPSTESSQGSTSLVSEVATSTSQSPSEFSSQTIAPTNQEPSESPAVNQIDTIGSTNAPAADLTSSTPAPSESQTERTIETISTSSSGSSEESSTPVNAGGTGGTNDASKALPPGSSLSLDPKSTTTASPITGEQTFSPTTSLSSSSSSSQSPEPQPTDSAFDVSASFTTQNPSADATTFSESSPPPPPAIEPQTLAPEAKSDQPQTASSVEEPSGSPSFAAPIAPESTTEERADLSSTTEAPSPSTYIPEVSSETSATSQSPQTSAAPILTELRSEGPKMSAPAESLSREPDLDLGSSTSAATTNPEVTPPPSSELYRDASASSSTSPNTPSELESPSSTAGPVAGGTETRMSPADEFISGVSTIKSAEFAPVNVTTSTPTIRGVASSVTIPWTDISNAAASSTASPAQISEASSAEPDIKYELPANATASVNGAEPASSFAPPSSSESDYEEVTDEPGCEYEGKSYTSAQQITRAHPCDFCFCFRGDIICLQQTCPPPVPHCFETVIDGFCCPRYECPVHTVRSSPNSSGLTLTPYETHSRLHAHSHDQPTANSTKISNVRGCFVDNKLIPVGKVIESASGPCLECLCDRSGMMKCNPKECTPEDPLLQHINREVLQSGMSRNQRRRR